MAVLRLLPTKRGQALVEMALMAPVLFLMVLGASDLSRLFYYSTGITNAAREGARHGAYQGTPSRPTRQSFQR
ncbi:MAG: pilus assembly protein [Chloroflexi bacterium]|nr:MAG: pilus assembly protein [Chloroflexota bacterium]